MIKPRKLALAAVALLVTYCGTPTEPNPTLGEGAPEIVGPIVARNLNADGSGFLGTIHVRAANDQCGIVVGIFDATQIQRKNSKGSFVDVPVEDLEVGARVAVWTFSVVLTSCPGQAGAEAIEVL